MMEYMTAWLWMTGLCLLCEIGHPGLFLFLSFACGTTAAAGVSWLNYSFNQQISICVLVTIVSFYFLYRYVCRLQQHPDRTSNSEKLIGMQGLVTQVAGTRAWQGYAQFGAEQWRIIDQHKKDLQVGSAVRATQIQGCTIYVIQEESQ